MTLTARLAWLACFIFICALVALGAQVPGFSHWHHPMALAGAAGVPGAGLYNAMVFVLPGGLLAWVAWRLRSGLAVGASWHTRIGAVLLMLSAIGFALQGVWPLAPDALEGAASGRHAAVWMAGWLAFVAGAALFALGSRRLRRATFVVVALCAALVLVGVDALAPGLSQRLAVLAWFVWYALAAGRRSGPTTRTGR